MLADTMAQRPASDGEGCWQFQNCAPLTYTEDRRSRIRPPAHSPGRAAGRNARFGQRLIPIEIGIVDKRVPRPAETEAVQKWNVVRVGANRGHDRNGRE